MSFSTTSYLAGVGSVVAALTIGFSGGFFMATPPEYVEPNRLQRVTSSAPISNPAPQTTAVAKPEIIEAKATAEPPRAAEQATLPVAIPVVAKATGTEQAPVAAAAAEPARVEAVRDASDVRAAEARVAERKRDDARKYKQRRKQREIEQATIAVKRMMRDRDQQQVADGFEARRFGFFGETD